MSPNVWPAAPLAEVFRFDEFTFDCGSRQLLRDKVERHLSPKAQQLLQVLLMARPRALSREELYDALWPSTFVLESNLASVVNELRRSLDDDRRSPRYIRTVHGFGYAFCGAATSSPVSRPTTMTLLCDGQTHKLFEGRNAVGRAPENHVAIEDRTISRRHAIVTLTNDIVSIEDLDSTNGTYVDGERIGRTPVIVNRDSQIKFGLVVAAIGRRRSSSATLNLDASSLKRVGV